MPTCSTSIDISAPASVVWAVMTDLPRYGEWNPLIVGVDLLDDAPAPVAGGRLRLHVDMEGKRRQILEWIAVWRPPTPGEDTLPAQLTYQFRGLMHRLHLVRGQRTQRLRPQGPEATRYETSEAFSGLLTAFLPLAAVTAGFEAHAAALKARAESLQGIADIKPLIGTSAG